MNITCAICGDIFTGLNPDETVYATVCGHLFHYNCLIEWFERSKTCPQCRQKTTEKNIIRIFFNNTNLTGADADPALLKYRVESLEFQLKMNEKEIKALTQEKKVVITQNKGLRKEIKDVQSKMISNEQKLFTVTDELKFLKSYCKQLSEVKLENEELKKELASCKSVNMIINGTVDEAKCAVDNSDLNPEHLQECVKYFKERIKKLEREHKNTEKEVFFYKREAATNKNMLSKLQEKYNALKLGQKVRDRSIIEISDDDSNVTFNGSNSSSHKENVSQVNNNDFSSSSEKNCRKTLSPLLEDSLLSKTRLLKVNPSYQSKSTSLIGITQPKLQFRIPKSVPLASADGDDKYVPTRYSAIGKVTKKPKKMLSATAVSSVRKIVSDKEKKISEHFEIL